MQPWVSMLPPLARHHTIKFTSSLGGTGAAVRNAMLWPTRTSPTSRDRLAAAEHVSRTANRCVMMTEIHHFLQLKCIFCQIYSSFIQPHLLHPSQMDISCRKRCWNDQKVSNNDWDIVIMRCAIFCREHVFIISRVYTALTAPMLLYKIQQFQQIMECRCKLAINTMLKALEERRRGVKTINHQQT